MQPRRAHDPDEPARARYHEMPPRRRAEPATARLYPSALAGGGWYVMTTNSAVAGAAYEPPPGHLLDVLEELLSGDTDVTISRRLNISPRTFSRRVAELLEYLGVDNRFQAGMEVALRGWVPLESYRQTIMESPQRNPAEWR